MSFHLLTTIIAFMLYVTTTQSTSKYEGVDWNEQKKQWQVECALNGKKSKYYFDNELDAVKTRNRVYKKMGILPKNPEISIVLNQKAKEQTSQYTGVYWNKLNRNWNTQLQLKNESTKYGGTFNYELDAAKRVNQLCEESGINVKNPGISGMPNEQKLRRKKNLSI